MTQVYFYLLIVICFGILIWGLQKTERVYQYPFIIGTIFTAFILPQAIALINNPGEGVTEEAVSRVMLMSCLCAAAAWIGYQLPINSFLQRKLEIPVDESKLLWVAGVLVTIGYGASFLISRLPEEARETTAWTGPITILNFFAQLVFPGLAIFLIFYVKRPNFWGLLLVTWSALPIIERIIRGRREPTITFILLIGLAIYFVRGLKPPRWIPITILVTMMLLIPLTHQYRSILKTGDYRQLLELNPIENFESFVQEGDILELRNAAIVIDATLKTGQYGYGTGYWNSFVHYFIPGQWIGKQNKENLKLKLTNYDLQELYDYKIHTGSTTPAVGDTFREFDYFGCLFFAVLGYIFKTIWYVADYRQRPLSQFIYSYLISPCLIVVTHGSQRFVYNLVVIVVIVFMTVLFCRVKSRNPRLNVV